MRRLREWLIALVVALAAFLTANLLETALIHTTHGDSSTLAFTSDVLLALLVMTATSLWLHVRNLRGALTHLERERVALDTELRLAATIQRTLLDKVHTEALAVWWHAITRPAGRIGGDFYDVLPVDDKRVLILVADVSGKGIPAAIGLASARAAFRMIAQSVNDPLEIARRWAQWLHADTGGMPYLTALLLRLDRQQRSVRYVNAGHPAGVILSASGVQRLEPTMSPLGLLEEARAESAEVDWPEGALGILVTDGVSEALENGADPLERLVMLARPMQSQPPQRVCTELLNAVREVAHGENVHRDDWTVLAFKTED
jgi:sigma-B regulation protein RsbU (phosphoserine phosphatase)